MTATLPIESMHLLPGAWLPRGAWGLLSQKRGGFLSADMVGFNSTEPVAEVYEIKPDSTSGKYRGTIQLTLYLGLLNRYGFPIRYVPGFSWQPPSRLYVEGKNVEVRGPTVGLSIIGSLTATSTKAR